MRAIKLCQNSSERRKFVLVGDGINRELLRDCKVFQNLCDLREKKKRYRMIVKKCKMSLQGRENVTLEWFLQYFRASVNIGEIFTTKVILDMLEDGLIVGENADFPDVYIEQKFPKILIKTDYLKNSPISSVSVVIYNTDRNLQTLKKKVQEVEFVNIEDISKLHVSRCENRNDNFAIIAYAKSNYSQNSTKVVLCKNICSTDKYKELCQKYEVCHIFRCTNKHLEWIKSSGKVEDLKQFQVQEDIIKSSEIIQATKDQKINFVCAGPGMGKSVFTQYLANHYSSEYWIINIDLRRYSKVLNKNMSTEECLKHFLDIQENKYSGIDLKIRELFIFGKKIVLCLDGLDELLPDDRENALGNIEKLAKEELILCVTARSHMRGIIEQKFNIIPWTLQEFNDQEQIMLVEKRLSSLKNKKKVGSVKTFLKKIESFNVKEILGSPLFIYILTELALTDSTIFDEQFHLPNLFCHFIQEKFNSYYKKITSCNSKDRVLKEMLDEQKNVYLQIYELKAIKMYLPKDVYEGWFIDHLKLPEKDRFGIFQKNQFHHSVFGEYFAACWLSKNYEIVKNLKSFFFDDFFRNIRFLFDMIMAKDCPAHLALLNSNYSLLQSFNEDYIRKKDAGGRNILHLAFSWGQKRPLLKSNTTFEETIEILDFYYTIEDSELYKQILKHLIKIAHAAVEERDVVFEWTCKEYADGSLSLYPLENFEKIDISRLNNFKDVATVLHYSIMYNYKNLFETIKDIPFIKYRFECSNLLHLAVRYQRNYFLKVILKSNRYCKEEVLNMGNKSQFIIPGSIIRDRCTETITVKCLVIFNTPLALALFLNNFEAMTVLVEKGANVNLEWEPGINDLYLMAITKNSKNEISFLKNIGGNISSKLLIYLMSENNIEVFKILLDKEQVKNYPDVFVAAAIHSQLTILQYFIDGGIDVNFTYSEGGFSALHVAAKRGNLSVMELLIKNGANVNATDNLCMTPLFSALKSQVIVEYLIKNGADVNVQNLEGHNVFHYIATEKSKSIRRTAAIFLDKNVDMNKLDLSGSTPLHHAVLVNNVQMVQFFLKNEAKADIKNNDGYTPYDFAKKTGNQEIIRLLEKFK